MKIFNMSLKKDFLTLGFYIKIELQTLKSNVLWDRIYFSTIECFLFTKNNIASLKVDIKILESGCCGLYL